MAGTAELPDAAVVRRVLGGEGELFGVLVERYRVEFARYSVSLMGDSDAAADAMQEAFIRAYDRLASCRDPSRFKAWFFRILTNQCHNARARWRRQAGGGAAKEVAAAETADGPLQQRELREAIAHALDRLTPEQREAFVLKHIEGRSYAEMAELLSTGEDALKMRVYRARDALKDELGELW